MALASVVSYFFPDLHKEERRKFILLGMTGFFVVGVYWLMRLLKQTIFFKVAFPEVLGWEVHQGALFQPIAKTWSPFIVLAAVLLYSKLVDLVKKHQLFYIICSFYGVLFAIIGAMMLIKTWYGPATVGRIPLATMGWVSYFATESFGSLVVAMFWSFTNSITTSVSAQRGFPLIITLMQVGAVGGAAILLASDYMGTLWPMVMIASFFIFAVVAMIAYFMAVMPADQLIGDRAAHATEKKKEGFFEGFISGLQLLVTRPYLLGVLVCSTFYEIAMQIIEYQMLRASSTQFTTDTAFSWFQGIYGISINGLSFLMALLGTSYLIKRIGVRLSLLVYPFVFAVVLAILFGYFLFGAPTAVSILWSTFIAMLIFKGMSYAFNNPVKEMMYIPTSKDAKFKSKAWIDMFGGRFAKATGAQVTGIYKNALHDLMIYGTLFSFGLIGVWILAAFYVGKRNQELVSEGKIVE